MGGLERNEHQEKEKDKFINAEEKEKKITLEMQKKKQFKT